MPLLPAEPGPHELVSDPDELGCLLGADHLALERTLLPSDEAVAFALGIGLEVNAAPEAPLTEV